MERTMLINEKLKYINIVKVTTRKRKNAFINIKQYLNVIFSSI